VFLVLDGHPAHRAKIVAAYVQSLKGLLELHFLPGYAPDLNPDEFVWNHLRQNGVTKKPLKQNEKLKDRVEKDLAEIKRSPNLARSFFRAESVAYVMDLLVHSAALVQPTFLLMHSNFASSRPPSPAPSPAPACPA
jgi:hypothetical protein